MMGNTPASQHPFQGPQTQPASVSAAWGRACLVNSKPLETTPAKHKDSSRRHAQDHHQGRGKEREGMITRNHSSFRLCHRQGPRSPALCGVSSSFEFLWVRLHTQNKELSNHEAPEGLAKPRDLVGTCPGRRCLWPTVTTALPTGKGQTFATPVP